MYYDYKIKLNTCLTFNEFNQLNDYIEQELPKIDSSSNKSLLNTQHSYVERIRLITYFKLFNKYQKLYTEEEAIISNDKLNEFYFYNFNLLIVADRKIQYYILIIILSYIMYFIPKNFTSVSISLNITLINRIRLTYHLK